MIPKEIDRKALIDAVRYIDLHGVPKTREARTWEVIVQGRAYPPKYLVSVAAKLATGKDWSANRFITTHARKFIAGHGFNVILKSDKVHQGEIAEIACIRVKWKDKDAFGSIDVLPLALFSQRSRSGVQHKVLGSDGEQSTAKCNVGTRGRVATLDYERFASFNLRNESELGVTRLTFGDMDRTEVVLVEWKRSGGSDFQTLPFEILGYIPEPGTPYSPPEKGSKRVLRSVRERPGQIKFRKDLKAAYDNKCCITGCAVAQVLEGAHIDPYFGRESDNIRNGLLLRRDIHALFDFCMISVNPETRVIRLARPILKTPEYADIEGRELTPPKNLSHSPDTEALRRHWTRFLLESEKLAKTLV